MSKIIYLSDSDRKSIIEEFSRSLEHPVNGVVSFRKEVTDVRRAEITFSEKAWLQMKLLVNTSDKEIGWHGVTEKLSPGNYYVNEIVVYPQTVTSATVEMDVESYSQWLMEHASDDRWDHLKFQGHSHVNMGVSPSGTDFAHQNKIINQLGSSDYYIFLITNKSGDIWMRIFDYEDNAIYENDEITHYVDCEGNSVVEWLDEAFELVNEYKALDTKVSPHNQIEYKTEIPKNTEKPRYSLGYLYDDLVDPFFYSGI